MAARPLHRGRRRPCTGGLRMSSTTLSPAAGQQAQRARPARRRQDRPSARSPTCCGRPCEAWEPYIWIVSDTRHQACAHLENVKAELTDNPRAGRRLPRRMPARARWRSDAIVLANGVTIEAFGTGQRIRGRRRRAHRPTLIVCDDLQNDGHMRSPPCARRSRDLVPRHAAEGRHAHAPTSSTWPPPCTATRWPCELQTTPGWRSRVVPGHRALARVASLWEEWERSTPTAATPLPKRPARSTKRNRPAMDAGAVRCSGRRRRTSTR